MGFLEDVTKIIADKVSSVVDAMVSWLRTKLNQFSDQLARFVGDIVAQGMQPLVDAILQPAAQIISTIVTTLVGMSALRSRTATQFQYFIAIRSALEGHV